MTEERTLKPAPETYSADEARQILRSRLKHSALKNATQQLGSRQPNAEEQLFEKNDITKHNLVKPPYDPTKMTRIVEAGGKLSTCIETYKNNIHGYGYEFKFEGTKAEEKTEPVLAEHKMLTDFFGQVNEDQTFTTLAKELRFDYEATGNAYIEAVRYANDDLAALYRADTRYVRLQAKQQEEIPVKVPLMRNGRLRDTTVYKRFRRFAMVINSTSKTIKFFKEWGDPRTMDATTGTYKEVYDHKTESWKTNPKWKQLDKTSEATEIIHLKQGNDTYGVPRYVGLSSVILGVSSADECNYRLFLDNAIPALAILVSGGRLTAESIEDIAAVLEGGKGVENWHKFAILEAVGGDDGNIDDKSTSSRIDFKELNKPTDAEFKSYIEKSESRIMAAFRLPPLLFGEVSDYSRATSSNSKLLTEDTVFLPERKSFDEKVQFTIMKDLGVQYHTFRTIGPRLLDGAERIDAFGKLARAGAMSVNQGLRIANNVLDLDNPPYTGEWAEIPVALLLELVKKQNVTEIDGVGGLTQASAKDAAEKLKEIGSNPVLDSISDDVEEVKSQLEYVSTLLATMEN